MMPTKLIILLLSIIALHASAQKEDKNWYFGPGTDGLIFDGTNAPKKVNNKLAGVGAQGIVVVNDPVSGDLKFYSDGQTVVTKQHTIMTNGTMLPGRNGVQSVQCCPVPDQCNKYYLFTNSAYPLHSGKLFYSIVDLTTGLGEVINKNTSLWDGISAEGMCLINKPNSNDYWLITSTFKYFSQFPIVIRLSDTTYYHVFSITRDGINPVPTTYVFKNPGLCYQMNYSDAAGKILVSGWARKNITTIDFDANSGIMSNPVTFNVNRLPYPCYGARFSPDGTKIYAGINDTIMQYDYNTSAWTQINSVMSPLPTDFKMGPDGKMYSLNTGTIAVIDFPDKSAVNNQCGYHFITFEPPFYGYPQRFPEFVISPKPPEANKDSIRMEADSILLIDVLNNDTDPQGDPISLDVIISAPKRGTAIIQGNKIRYTANALCQKQDTMIYQIRDNNCQGDTALVIIYASEPIDLALTYKSPVCKGDSVIIVSTKEQQNAAYTWTGPGNFYSTASSVKIAPANNTHSGIYTLSAGLVNSHCPLKTLTATINVLEPAEISLGSDTTLCADSFVLKVNGPFKNYTWQDGSGSSVFVGKNSGRYRITVTDTNNYCVNTDEVFIKLLSYDTFSIKHNSPVCKGDQIILYTQANPQVSYTWIAPGNNFYSSAPSMIVSNANLSDSGIYTLKLKYISCPEKTLTVNIRVNKPTEIGFVNDTSICADSFTVKPTGEFKNYLWQDGSINPVFTARNTGTYFLHTTDTNNCNNMDTVHVQLSKDINFSVFSKSPVCKGDTLFFSTQEYPQTSYTWTGPGGFYSTSPSVRINNANRVHSGIYTLTATHASCPAKSYTTNLQVAEPLDIGFGNDTSLCPTDSLILFVSGTVKSYLWQDGSANPVFTVKNGGTYSVMVTDTNNCSNSDTLLVHYFPLTKANLIENLRVCMPDTLIGTTTAFKKYLWQDGATTPFLRATAYGKYTLNVTDSNDCSSLHVIELINNCPALVIAPNAFTPNEDGINDTFYPYIDNMVSLKLSIYNRWGELIYESTELNKGWDGTYREKLCLPDTYIYVIEGVTINGLTKVLNGNVTLMR